MGPAGPLYAAPESGAQHCAPTPSPALAWPLPATAFVVALIVLCLPRVVPHSPMGTTLCAGAIPLRSAIAQHRAHPLRTPASLTLLAGPSAATRGRVLGSRPHSPCTRPTGGVPADCVKCTNRFRWDPRPQGPPSSTSFAPSGWLVPAAGLVTLCGALWCSRALRAVSAPQPGPRAVALCGIAGKRAGGGTARARSLTPSRCALRHSGANPEAGHVGSLAAVQDTVHLVSMLKPGAEGQIWSRAGNDCWEWKDAVLGDGADRWVPRPRTVRRFAAVIVASATAAVPVEECVVLANCARLDVYVATAAPTSGAAVAGHVAEQIAVQFAAWRRNPRWLAWADDEARVVRPGSCDAATDAAIRDSASDLDPQALAAVLTPVSGVEAVAQHCCVLAVGLAGKDPAAFRPFAARDAHVMLQLKRTLDAAAAPATSPPASGDPFASAFGSRGGAFAMPAPCGPRLGIVLRAGLAAGKAARNPDILPEVAALRQYSGGGRYAVPESAHSTVARRTAAAAVARDVVGPAVAQCAADLRALDSAAAITRLRARAEDVVAAELGAGAAARHAEVVRASTRRLLHAPTVALREGDEVDEEAVLQAVLSAARRAVETATNSTSSQAPS